MLKLFIIWLAVCFFIVLIYMLMVNIGGIVSAKRSTEEPTFSGSLNTFRATEANSSFV